MTKIQTITEILKLADKLKSAGCKQVKVSVEDMAIVKVSFENAEAGFMEDFKVSIDHNADALWGFVTFESLKNTLENVIKIYKLKQY